MITASAPAKIILLGEHAVVYGQPAIATPVSSLRATAVATPNTTGLCVVARDLNRIVELSENVDNAITLLLHLVLQRLQIEAPNLTITVTSAIPLASGLGSGAAVSTAIARALAVAVNRTLPEDALNAIVYEVEKLHHGTPSGIDNTTIVYEQPVFFVRGQPIEPLTIQNPFTLLIGDTGQGALTKIAVGDVRALYEQDPDAIQPLLNAVGSLVIAGRQALEQGDAARLGQLMFQNHQILQRLTISSPELDRLVTTAVRAGALGAKLSGGGRGGNMIALVQPDQAPHVEQALRKAGAVQVFQTVLRGQ